MYKVSSFKIGTTSPSLSIVVYIWFLNPASIPNSSSMIYMYIYCVFINPFEYSGIITVAMLSDIRRQIIQKKKKVENARIKKIKLLWDTLCRHWRDSEIIWLYYKIIHYSHFTIMRKLVMKIHRLFSVENNLSQ